MSDINVGSFAEEARRESSAGRAANYNAPIEQARGLLDRPDNFSENLGGGDSAMRSAIRSKYAGTFGRKMDRLNLENIKGANADHLKKLEVATQMAAEEQKVNFEKEMMRQKMAKAKQAARAQLVGTVLGIVGGVGVGVATGGNPAGIMAGQALGQGVGTAAAGGLE